MLNKPRWGRIREDEETVHKRHLHPLQFMSFFCPIFMNLSAVCFSSRSLFLEAFFILLAILNLIDFLSSISPADAILKSSARSWTVVCYESVGESLDLLGWTTFRWSSLRISFANGFQVKEMQSKWKRLWRIFKHELRWWHKLWLGHWEIKPIAAKVPRWKLQHLPQFTRSEASRSTEYLPCNLSIKTRPCWSYLRRNKIALL